MSAPFQDDIAAIFRFIVVVVVVAFSLAAIIFIAKNVAPAIFLIAEPDLAAKMFGSLAPILFAGLILAVAHIVAAFMHLRRR